MGDAVRMFAVVQQLMVVLAGLGFVCLVTAIFVVLARFFARKVLSDDDGSSLP
jgi:hypothetical protein